MIQVPGAEEDPALPVAIGVDGVFGKTALQVKGALQGPRQGLERQREVHYCPPPSQQACEGAGPTRRSIHEPTFESGSDPQH